jgi:hypothetical protein
LSQPINNSQCLHRRSPRRTHLLRLTRKITTSKKTMETLSLQNLHRYQTRKGEQNLKPSRRHELRKLRILWKHLPKKKLKKKMMRVWIDSWKQ